MLKKLFKHEWKDCWQLLSLLNVAVLVLTVIGVLTFRSDIWRSAEKNNWIAMMLTSYILFYVDRHSHFDFPKMHVFLIT